MPNPVRLRDYSKIEAVKRVRQKASLGLAESKALVEQLECMFFNCYDQRPASGDLVDQNRKLHNENHALLEEIDKLQALVRENQRTFKILRAALDP